MQASLASGAGGPLWPAVEGRSSGGPSPFAEDCSSAHARARTHTHTHTRAHTHARTHTHVYWVSGGRGGQSWFILLGQCLPHPPFSLSTFSRDSGRDQKVWVPCPFSAWGDVRGSVCLSWPGQEKFASGPSSALLSPEAPGQCSSWEGPAVQGPGSPGPGTAGGRAGACLLVKDWAPAGTVEG